MDSQPVRRYLDSAATSWPKPEAVLAASAEAARSVGAAAGRGTHQAAQAADRMRRLARRRAADLLGGVDPSRVALPAGGTLGLNMAIHGVLQPGDRVIATAADHNASLRTLHFLAQREEIELTVVPCDSRGWVDPAAIERAWRPATRLVVCSHAANVTGMVQDAAAMANIAHGRGGLLLLDAAQTLGQIPCDVPGYGADIVVAPAHKWLQGPSGAAILWVREGIDLVPLVQGGTGTQSDSLEMPEAFTDRMEPGTPDLPALAGLTAAVDWLERFSISAVAAHCRSLAQAAADGLRAVAGVRVIGGGQVGVPIVSFTAEGYDPAELALLLEQLAGIEARAGYHCAALVHEHLSTAAGGTLRVSFGPHNTDEDVAILVETMGQLLQRSLSSSVAGALGSDLSSRSIPPWQK